MLVKDIRNSFLNFFEEKDHLRIPSSSLVPHNDPTLMFTTAGMVQFKPYFMGIDKPPASRLTSIQKCFRTTDIELVGDSSHLTFFEMLGNFSVGDYYKDDAIEWAWEFLVNELSIDKKRLWATVYKDDEEAYNLWKKIGIPEQKILRYDAMQGNWWGPPGLSGPCGPCSELHYDYGEPLLVPRDYNYNSDHPALDSGRFLEIWNLVFMSYFQNEDGKKNALPSTNIDTGAGLERLASVIQGTRSVYETDELSTILPASLEALNIQNDLNNSDQNFWLRSISEHSRALAFLIADGVHPSNEGRGYVLRRLLRRAVYAGYRLNRTDPFLSSIVSSSIDISSHAYPELLTQKKLILELVNNEESRFQETLDKGISLLEEHLNKLSAGKILSGDIAFNLYDTHGLPFELVKEISLQKLIEVDGVGFAKCMEEQQSRSRLNSSNAISLESSYLKNLPTKITTEFIGYEHMVNKAKVLHVSQINDTDNVTGLSRLILDTTTMYPEGGGQIADNGIISSANSLFEVSDVQSFGESIIHFGKFVKGFFELGEIVEVNVNKDLRIASASNHTATHLLFAALRNSLGDHVKQAGSYVGPDRLRFDYTTTITPSIQELNAIQMIVNAKIRDNIHSHIEEMDYETAIDKGANAFFGDKYSSIVRVVEYCESRGSHPVIDNACFSRELCGGTHLSSTGQAGLFIITSDTSIGSGIRRIEAITGLIAERYLSENLSILNELGAKFKIPSIEILSRIEIMESQIRNSNIKIENLEKTMQINKAGLFIDNAIIHNDVKIIKELLEDTTIDAMKALIDEIRRKSDKVVIILSSVRDHKVQLIIGVSNDLVSVGIDAGKLVKEGSLSLGGGGGGKPSLAQGGGDNIDKLDNVLTQLSNRVIDLIK
ncbi:MAG: alanine--tRNA ligase [Dehalococcoidia bacterium]